MEGADIDPHRFTIAHFDGRGFGQAYVRENPGGLPLLLVHGWPESKRIWWKVIEPLAARGFEVIVPDLRGFGDSDAGPDDFGDVASHSRDLHALLGSLGHERAVLCAGDLGGPVIQDMGLRFPGLAHRLVLFNSPLPYDKERMAHLRTRPPAEAADYFVRQGTDADGLAAELVTPQQRRRYIATFYSSRFWAHPGAFLDGGAPPMGPFGGGPIIDFHTEPFGDAATFRASLGGYESVFDASKQSEAPLLARNPATRALILFGPSDHVIYPDFDQMAEVVFPDHDGAHRLADCGHFVPWEAPAALVEEVTRFCSDLLDGG